MKRFFIGLFIFISVVSFSDETFVIRGSSWLMSKKQVLKNERNKLLLNRNDTFVYRTDISGIRMFVAYDFVYNEFLQLRYVSNKPYLDIDKSIQDFNIIKKVIIDKYGKYKKEEINYTSEEDRNKGIHYCLTMNKVKFIYRWNLKNKKTYIDCVLWNVNNEILINIYFSHYSFKEKFNSYLKNRNKNRI